MNCRVLCRKYKYLLFLICFLGEVGGWKNYFTVAQSEYIDKLFEEKLSHTGIKFTYEL